MKAKRSRLQYTSGFVAHMYDISAHVTPVLAWGFLGPEGKLKDVCEYFKVSYVIAYFLKFFALMKNLYDAFSTQTQF